jgi:hypothetical protein
LRNCAKSFFGIEKPHAILFFRHAETIHPYTTSSTIYTSLYIVHKILLAKVICVIE